MGSVLQLTKSRGNVLDMKMLFLDTVVMPVLSQMMRGREILLSACCCRLLNTPVFSHQNLRGDTRGLCTQAGLGREGLRGLEPLPGRKRAATAGGALTCVMPSAQRGGERGCRGTSALRPPRRPPGPHSRCTGSWARAHSRGPVPWPGAASVGVQRTMRWVYKGSTQRGTPFSSFPKGAIRAR